MTSAPLDVAVDVSAIAMRIVVVATVEVVVMPTAVALATMPMTDAATAEDVIAMTIIALET